MFLRFWKEQRIAIGNLASFNVCHADRLVLCSFIVSSYSTKRQFDGGLALQVYLGYEVSALIGLSVSMVCFSFLFFNHQQGLVTQTCVQPWQLNYERFYFVL